MAEQLRGPFEKFVDSPDSKKRPSPHLHEVPSRSLITPSRNSVKDSPYFSEWELCGGAVTVSFSNKVSPRTLQMALL
jgi:hypothetical protein